MLDLAFIFVDLCPQGLKILVIQGISDCIRTMTVVSEINAASLQGRTSPRTERA